MWFAVGVSLKARQASKWQRTMLGPAKWFVSFSRLARLAIGKLCLKLPVLSYAIPANAMIMLPGYCILPLLCPLASWAVNFDPKLAF